MHLPVKVLIVDDHPLFRQGVRFYLSSLEHFEVVGETSSAEQALESISGVDADVVLMDLKMPGMDGITATEALLSTNPGLRILVLTSYALKDKVQEAIKAGAAGYCLKDAPPEELAAAIRAVAGGGTYLGRGIAPEDLVQPASPDSGLPGAMEELTRRELDVLQLLSLGLGNREIAEHLVVSEKTVKTHVANILQKLGVKTRTQAALLASKLGLAGGSK